MAQFATKTFDAARYLSFRPTYSQTFYELTYAYHKRRGGSFDRAVDVGCGPGFVARDLASRFKHVSGADPSPSMIAVGLQPESAASKIDYHVASAEDLRFLPDASVDLVTAGQAAHWFKYPQVWHELERVLKPRGTAAFWGYGEFFLPAYPALSPKITTFMRSPSGIGPFWEQPGRSLVEGLLDDIPFPSRPDAPCTSSWEGFPAAEHARDNGEPLAQPWDERGWDASSFVRIKRDPSDARLVLHKRLDWAKLEAYLRTASAVHKYKAEHPSVDGEDIVGRFVRMLREDVQREAGAEVHELDVEWPAVILLAGKR